MSGTEDKPWEQLFPPPPAREEAFTASFRLVLKGGVPLLLLPTHRCAIRPALALYPAQTPTARIARSLLGAALRIGLPVGAKIVHLRLGLQSPFLLFLSGSISSQQRTSFAILLGNPRAPGRRFLLLVFAADGQPLRVVKAGADPPGVALIRREAAFLRSAPRELLHAPTITGEFTSTNLEALALEYCAGPNPAATDLPRIAELLGSWLDSKRLLHFAELPAAQRLLGKSPQDARIRRVLSELEGALFHPTILHGDFAPWNIRVSPERGCWRVLDWERGELSGPPAWDWFHFVIQHEILVRRASPDSVAKRLEVLAASQHFAHYAVKAGIASCVSPLLLAYLLYCCHLQRQAEGMAQIEALLEILLPR